MNEITRETRRESFIKVNKKNETGIKRSKKDILVIADLMCYN